MRDLAVNWTTDGQEDHESRVGLNVKEGVLGGGDNVRKVVRDQSMRI